MKLLLMLLFIRVSIVELFLSQNVKRGLSVTDETGKTKKALDVFALCIHYLKDHLIKQLQSRLGHITLDDVYWVITIPAIWNEPAKTLMREAAIKAGIEDCNLDLALEPEAAAIYCKQLDYQISGSLRPFDTGTVYMILDCGGGTIDVTVHEMLENGKLKERHSATGGSYGGKTVEEAFIKVLQTVVIPNDFTDYANDNRGDFYELMRRFEARKRTFNPSSPDDIKLEIPPTFREFCTKNGESLEVRLKKSVYATTIQIRRDKMMIKPELFVSFFDKALREISDLTKCVVTEVPEVETILLVGGFSAAPVIKQLLDQKHPGMKIIVPEDPSTAILKGAVLYGKDPDVVSFRVSRCTYGIATCRRFTRGKDPDDRKKTIDGKSMIDGVFQKHIKIGAMMPAGQVLEYHQYDAISNNQGLMVLDVYQSVAEEPKYVWEDSCTKIGELEITLPFVHGRQNKTVCVGMTFTRTQLTMEAIVLCTGEATAATFKILEESVVSESMA